MRRLAALSATAVFIVVVLPPSVVSAVGSHPRAAGHAACATSVKHGNRHVRNKVRPRHGLKRAASRALQTVARTHSVRHLARIARGSFVLSPPDRGVAVRPETASAVAVSGGLVVGLADGAAGWGGASTAPRLDEIVSATHTSWLREEFVWSTIEPSPGAFDFSYYDHYMLLAAQRGIHVVALLDGAPGWATGTPNTIPSDPTAYAQFVAAVVGRYGAHGSFWTAHPDVSRSPIGTYELWNEPYFDNGDNGDYNPARYANLVKAAGSAGHAADPTAKFLLEAEMQSHLDGVWTWWVDALYHAVPDLNDYFDGIASHDYGSDTTSLDPMIAGQAYSSYGHVRRIEDIRHQFIDHGAARKPFWITEVGWSTCTEASIDCVTETQQAANLTALFGHLHNGWKSWVQAAFIYRYQDGAAPSTVQDGYGLTHLDGTPKPALAVFNQAAANSAR
jgi:hypothetical protein